MKNVPKQYRNIDEQIEYLRQSKKIIIEESDRKYFEQRNYIELINPYKEFICFGRDSNNKHIYKNFTKFSSLIELIKLDDSICDHLFPLLRTLKKSSGIFYY